jgi:hypothetical protein
MPDSFRAIGLERLLELASHLEKAFFFFKDTENFDSDTSLFSKD